MNPTSNKNDFEDLTTNLRYLAYSYLEKYNPSKQQLKVYLLKKYLLKIKGTKSKKEVTSIIDEIISNLEKNKLLNDEMYSDSKARIFLRRGYSLNKINQSLRSKGIEDKYVRQSIEKMKDDQIKPDFVSALNLCKRITKISSFFFRAFLTNIKKSTPKNVTERIIIDIVLIIKIFRSFN